MANPRQTPPATPVPPATPDPRMEPNLPNQTSTPPPTESRPGNVMQQQQDFGAHAEPGHTDNPNPPQPSDAVVQPKPGQAPVGPAESRVRDDKMQPGETQSDVAPDHFTTPKDFADKPGIKLLMEACEIFGIDPNPKLPVYDGKRARPGSKVRYRELMSWRFYEGDVDAGVPDRVVLVTAGGRKLSLSSKMGNESTEERFDEETIGHLRSGFHAFRRNPITNEIEPLPLPDDLTLPGPAVLGVVTQKDHVYPRGYLRSGGRAAADQRDQDLAKRNPTR